MHQPTVDAVRQHIAPGGCGLHIGAPCRAAIAVPATSNRDSSMDSRVECLRETSIQRPGDSKQIAKQTSPVLHDTDCILAASLFGRVACGGAVFVKHK